MTDPSDLIAANAEPVADMSVTALKSEWLLFVILLATEELFPPKESYPHVQQNHLPQAAKADILE